MALPFLAYGNGALTSNDGIQWLGWSAPFTISGSAGNLAANSTCAVVGGDAAGTPVAARTTTGNIWTSATVANPHPTDQPFITTIGINDSFGVALGIRPISTPGNQAELWTSGDNGVTWTDVAQPSFLSGVGLVGFGKIYCDNSLTIVYGTIGSGTFTKFAMTTTDGSTWVASTAPTKFIYKIVKTASHYYGLAFDDDNTAFLAISTDAINWAYKSQPLDNTYDFSDIAASDSLVVIVGSNGGFTAGFVETSADGGTTWTSVALDSSIDEVDSVGFNGKVWVAGAETGVNFDPAILTSTDGGVTWPIDLQPTFYAFSIIPYATSIPTSGYNLYVYDDCCHLFTSFDLGVTWALSFQDQATIQDGYTDAYMAIADGDYTTLGSSNTGFQTTKQGILALSLLMGRTGTWKYTNPDSVLNPPGDSSNYVEWQSGAITKNAQTVILMPTFKKVANVSIDTGHIRITNDGGITWADTAVSLGARQWFYACIAKGGQIMYAMSLHSPGVSKSTDGGVTWADLSASPNIVGYIDEGGGRIRCSDDGSVVIVALDGPGSGAANKIYISTDGGTTWSSPVTLGSTSSQVDAALSSDGSVMMAVDQHGSTTSIKVWYSTNTGSSWSSHDLTGSLPALSAAEACCNVSPDGLVMLVGWPKNDLTLQGHVAAVSLDSGATWNIFIIPFEAQNPVVAAFVTPPPPNNPYGPGTPVPPFPAPKGGYIIERLDDRVWPTVENVWAVDCGFTLAQPTPDADLTVESI